MVDRDDRRRAQLVDPLQVGAWAVLTGPTAILVAVEIAGDPLARGAKRRVAAAEPAAEALQVAIGAALEEARDVGPRGRGEREAEGIGFGHEIPHPAWTAVVRTAAQDQSWRRRHAQHRCDAR